MATSQPSGAQPSPALFFETTQGYQRSYALKAAVDLDLFTAIAKGNQSTVEIARACSASERGTRMLCDYLASCGLIEKADAHYTLTADSAFFLDSRKPSFIGRALNFLMHPFQLNNYQHLADTVRKGTQTEHAHSSLEPEDSIWIDFARGMAPLVFPFAQQIAGQMRQSFSPGSPLKVLDIAAGHGMFGITVAQQFPGAQIYASDWGNVLQVAQENARALGVAERHHLIPGSAFEAHFGSGYDAVLLTNFLHHFDPPTNETLLKKVFNALKPGGEVFILEFVPNEDRISPPTPARFSLIMLANTGHGDAYTFGQLSEMCSNAGFRDPQFHVLQPAGFQSLVTTKKPA